MGDVYEHLRTLLPEPEPETDLEAIEDPEVAAPISAERAEQNGTKAAGVAMLAPEGWFQA